MLKASHENLTSLSGGNSPAIHNTTAVPSRAHLPPSQRRLPAPQEKLFKALVGAIHKAKPRSHQTAKRDARGTLPASSSGLAPKPVEQATPAALHCLGPTPSTRQPRHSRATPNQTGKCSAGEHSRPATSSPAQASPAPAHTSEKARCKTCKAACDS